MVNLLRCRRRVTPGDMAGLGAATKRASSRFPRRGSRSHTAGGSGVAPGPLTAGCGPVGPGPPAGRVNRPPGWPARSPNLTRKLKPRVTGSAPPSAPASRVPLSERAARWRLGCQWLGRGKTGPGRLRAGIMIMAPASRPRRYLHGPIARPPPPPPFGEPGVDHHRDRRRRPSMPCC